MKRSLLFLTLLISTATLAQQPNPGFGRKEKTTAPAAGLAERLDAQVMPVPANQAGQQTLTTSTRTTEPLRLRVVRDSETGLPVYIERKSTATQAKASGARLSAAAAASATFAFLGQVRSLLNLDNPQANFTVARTETDDLGQTHVRLTQTYAGVPVLGSELVAHLTNGDVTLLNGRYQPMPASLSTTPKLALADAASRALTDVRKTSPVRSFGDNILRMKSTEGELCVFPMPNGGAKLTYQLTVRPNLLERWEYVIDAQTGDVLDKYNHTCTFAGPIKTSARDLNGVTRSVQTYQQSGGYYMIDVTRPMFSATASKMPDDPVGALWTIDSKNTFGDNQTFSQITSANNADWSPAAVSAHYNAGIAYDYYRTTHNRNALNGKGETIVSVINVADDGGTGLDNAYWNGSLMAYGNGNKAFKPLAGALDVAGHEMTHGVIQNTANLQYKSQSGAINESMADVFGVLIDRANWTLGEEIIKGNYFPSGALRDVSNPNQGGPTKDPNGYQPAVMSQYDNTTDDNGGVHINSGIPNFAFYKFASVVGKDKAEKVYYRALTTYLVRTSQFLDLRLAIIKATGDLFGATGAEVTAAKSAFDAVGIVENGQSTPPSQKQPDVPIATGQDLILLADVGTAKLYSTVVGTSKFDAKSTIGLLHRPSVTDDGQYAYYVTTDKKIRSVNLTGAPSETVISNEAIWDNVAISKDGTKLAALTATKDASMWVYSYAKKKWTQFKLYNPTSAQGVTTGDVQYADSFEWDFTGENVVYDAYNALKDNAGKAIDYWDVGFINVWDNKTGDFAKGSIEKLFSNLDKGESVGNPSFSKNSPDVIAFDYFNSTDDSYYVVATDLSTGSLQGVYQNNTLGFPSYSRLDNKLVFSTSSSKSEDVSVIGVGTDKITPSGSVSVLYTGAQWPVWYTQASRLLPTKTTQTIIFGAIADRYTNQGDLLLTATSSANLPVSFQVKSGPATLSGSTMKFTGTGAVTVRASQDGNTQFYAATAVERTFTVLAVTGIEPLWADVLAVYPNPARTTLTVELPVSETVEQLSLKTLTGTTVLQPAIRAHQPSATLEVGQLPAGLYFLHIQTATGVVSRKVVKE